MTSETHSISSAETDRAKLLARRRFLKGTTLSLPAVMTLTPGAANAMVSVTCGEKALESNLTAPHLLTPPGSTDDGCFRMSVNLYDKLVPQYVNGKWKMVPNNTPTYFLGMHNQQPVWRRCSTGENLGGSQPSDCNPSPQLTYPVGQAVVHISAENGDIVAVGSPSAPPNCIITSAAGSCMASLAATGG